MPSGDWRWLESTKFLQEKVYHYDFEGLRQSHEELTQLNSPKTGLTAFIDWNISAAIQELAEMRVEFSWKPWARDPAFYNRDRIRDEAIDVLHFLGNILVAIDVTDGELEEWYRIKQQLNRSRQASGTYSAKKGGLAEGSDNT